MLEHVIVLHSGGVRITPTVRCAGRGKYSLTKGMADAKSSSQDHMIAICSACEPDGKMETVRARIVAECSALSVSWRCLLHVVCFMSLAVACDQVNVHDVDIEETEANVVAMPDRDADDVCSAIESSVQVQSAALTRAHAQSHACARSHAGTLARARACTRAYRPARAFSVLSRALARLGAHG